MSTGTPGYLSQALVLAYVAASLGVFATLVARSAAWTMLRRGPILRRTVIAGLGLGGVAAGVAATVECREWWVRGATEWGDDRGSKFRFDRYGRSVSRRD